MTITALVCCRLIVPSPRTELDPSLAFAGTTTLTLALPVFEVSTVATVTHFPSTSQRMRTDSFFPYPRNETSTVSPGETRVGVTLMRGATSNWAFALFAPSLKTMVLPPAVVAEIRNEPEPAPVFDVTALPTSTLLPPGRRQVMVTVEFGVKFESEKLTVELTVPRVEVREAPAGPGIETVTAPVCAASVGLSPRTLLAPAPALFGTGIEPEPVPSAVVVIVLTAVHLEPISQRTSTCSFAPNPLKVTVTSWPGTTEVGATLMRGAGAGVAVGVGVAVCVGEGVGVGVSVGVGDGSGVGDGDGVAVSVGIGVGEGVGVGEGASVAVGEAVTVGVGVSAAGAATVIVTMAEVMYSAVGPGSVRAMRSTRCSPIAIQV